MIKWQITRGKVNGVKRVFEGRNLLPAGKSSVFSFDSLRKTTKLPHTLRQSVNAEGIMGRKISASTTKKKAASKKKTASKSESAKSKGVAKSGKAAASHAHEEIILKQFDSYFGDKRMPENLFIVSDEDGAVFTAPPFAKDKKENERIVALLSRSFDLKTFPKEAPRKKAAAVKKKAVSREEVILKKFETCEPGNLFIAAEKESGNFSAPPFADEKIRNLLSRVFDIKSFPSRPLLSREELILKKFETCEPGNLFVAAEKESGNFSAPPFADEKIGKLLSIIFDIKSFPSRPPLSREELILKKFETCEPGNLFVAAEKESGNFSAPSFADEKIGELLSRVFDMKTFPAKAPEEKAVPEKPAIPEKKVPEITQSAEKVFEKPKEIQEPVKIIVTPKEIKARESSSLADFVFDDLKGIADPMERTLNLSIAGLAFIVGLIIIASIVNIYKFNVKTAGDALEIWQGSFAPSGEELLVSLPGVKAPAAVKGYYSKEDVFPLAFDFYREKAYALLNGPGIPDFEKVKSYLNQAISFGTHENISKAYADLKKVDVIILMNKADIAAGKKTKSDLESAMAYLEKAMALNNAASFQGEDSQEDLIKRKMEIIKDLMKAYPDAPSATESK